MPKKPAPTIEVTCPCCEAKLTVDTDLAVVLAHTAPVKAAPDVDISDAARILADQAQKREDKFRGGREQEGRCPQPEIRGSPQESQRPACRKTVARFRSLSGAGFSLWVSINTPRTFTLAKIRCNPTD
jgi:hypothetical protein